MFNAHPADTAPLPAGEAVLEEGQMRKKIRNFSQSDKHIDFTCTRLRKKKKKTSMYGVYYLTTSQNVTSKNKINLAWEAS